VNEIENRNLTATGLGASDTLANLLKGCGLTYNVGLSPNGIEQLGTHALIRKVNFAFKLFGKGNVNRVVLSHR
jgi:hypothetical protein